MSEINKAEILQKIKMMTSAIADIKPTFEEAMHFDDNGLAIARKDGKLGLIDNKGVWVVSPEFNRIWPYKKICLVRIGLKFDVIRIIK